MTDRPWWQTTSGTWERKVSEEHQCPTPIAADKGDVWRCDCRRRWKCVESGFCLTRRADWFRLYWPWPRRSRPRAQVES